MARAWVEVEWESEDDDLDAGRALVESACDALMIALVDHPAVVEPAISATLDVPEPSDWVMPPEAL